MHGKSLRDIALMAGFLASEVTGVGKEAPGRDQW
jgi:hypothetical protein